METPTDEAKPVVMNGYLQKPTVGTAAARAIRPIRSNVSSQDGMRPGSAAQTKKAPETKTSAVVPEEKKTVPAEGSGDSAAASGMARDTDLPEMVKAQRELEQRMKYLEKEMKRLPNLDDQAPKS
ncbi:MAG: hypothetical protein J5636_02810 [Clostridiales bacterium]|nr:hypothetical protein [Clostridiales bacterium]